MSDEEITLGGKTPNYFWEVMRGECVVGWFYLSGPTVETLYFIRREDKMEWTAEQLQALHAALPPIKSSLYGLIDLTNRLTQ